MLFIRPGKLFAYALIILGGFGVIMGLGAAFTLPDAAARAAFARNDLGADSFGQELDQRFLMIGAGVVIGLLAEIADRLGVKRNKDAEG